MPFGEFNVPGNTHVKVEFPCTKCNGKVKGVFIIKPSAHSNETVNCPGCGEEYDVVVMHDNGTGVINVTALGNNQQKVNAKGLP